MLKKNTSLITKTLSFCILFILSLNSCGSLKPDWSKTAEPDGRKRAQQNVIEGRGLKSVFKDNKSMGGNFDFASSNPLWRASLDTLDFLVLSNVDYSGGVIISDWYSENNQKESIKITLRFLSNEIRSDSIKIIVHNKKCKSIQNCEVNEIDSNIKFELKKSILAKAARLEKDIDKKKK